MTDIGYISRAFGAPVETVKSEAVRLPTPQPLGVPVLVYDCVTPVAGETLLSLLMKRMMRKDQP